MKKKNLAVKKKTLGTTNQKTGIYQYTECLCGQSFFKSASFVKINGKVIAICSKCNRDVTERISKKVKRDIEFIY